MSEDQSKSVDQVSRRQVIQGLAAAAAAGVSLNVQGQGHVAGQQLVNQMMPAATAQQTTALPTSDRLGSLLPTRPFGRADESITMMGLGGQHFQREIPDGQHQTIIEKSLEGGIRFFDTAHFYGPNQRSEKLFGQFLTPKYRDDVFIMSKSASRDAAGAKRELDLSLKNMKTDQLDLWQVHTLESVADADRRIQNGVFDAFFKAKEEGKVRYIGFTGHRSYQAHLRVLEWLESEGLEMDSCQLPLNVSDPSYESHTVNVLPVLNQRGYAVLAMKTMVGGRLNGTLGEFGPNKNADIGQAIIPNKMSFAQASHYVWALPIACRIVGFNNLSQLQENIQACRSFKGMTEQEQTQLVALAKDQSGPMIEFYKD